MRTDLALLLVTISISVVVTSGQVASKCDPNICRLPSCYCGGTSVPGGLSRYVYQKLEKLNRTNFKLVFIEFQFDSKFNLYEPILYLWHSKPSSKTGFIVHNAKDRGQHYQNKPMNLSSIK